MENPPIPPVDADLVFVCGALRSGTTLLRLMIDGHPLLSNPGEMDFLFEPPMSRDGTVDLSAYARALSVNRVFAGAGLTFRDGLGYEDQVRDFIGQLRAPGKRLTINIHRHFDRIPSIFPQARYVHLLRDPRDAAKSAIGMGWAGNVFHGVDHWINSERDFERLAAKAPAANIFTLRNEDLIRATETELRRLCAFLRVNYDPGMLEYPSRSTYGAPDIRLIEQWRRDLSSREVMLVESKVRAMMIARGYQPASEQARAPGGLERLGIRLANSWGRWRFAARRYGLRLATLDLAVGRIPLKGLREYARRRKSEIDRLHVK